MASQATKVEALNGIGQVTVRLMGSPTAIQIFDWLGAEALRLFVYGASVQPAVPPIATGIAARGGLIEIGGMAASTDGGPPLTGPTFHPTLTFDGVKGEMLVGGTWASGRLALRTVLNNETVRLSAEAGDLRLGGGGKNGKIVLLDAAGQERVHLDAQTGLSSGSPSADGNLHLGGAGVNGEVVLYSSDGKKRIHLKAANGDLYLGGEGVNGDIVLYSSDGKKRIHLKAANGNLYLGGEGANGDIVLYNSDGKKTVHLRADYGNLILGGEGADGDIVLLDTTGQERIHLDAQNGDIVLNNADFAEEFDVAEPLDPGTVVVLTESARVGPATRPYDRAVVGVVAGAGGFRPAIVADRQDRPSRQAITLLGKAFCRATANREPIRVGDLLTTSDVPGHAMKVSRDEPPSGVLLGKALGQLASGCDLIPIVSVQAAMGRDAGVSVASMGSSDGGGWPRSEASTACVT